jgi:hypothetical protein
METQGQSNHTIKLGLYGSAHKLFWGTRHKKTRRAAGFRGQRRACPGWPILWLSIRSRSARRGGS